MQNDTSQRSLRHVIRKTLSMIRLVLLFAGYMSVILNMAGWRCFIVLMNASVYLVQKHVPYLHQASSVEFDSES